MKEIASADIETDPFKHGRKIRAFLAGWYDGNVIRKFWGENCLKECYESMRKFKGYIYLHNGGKFDLHHFLDVIPASDIIPDSNPPINGRISSIQIVDGPTFLDSYLILPVPLAAHGKEEIDYRIFEPDKREIPANKRKINSYFDTDLISLYDFVSDFIGEYGHGLTLAGRAFAAGKKLLDIKQFPQTNEHYDKRYRNYYFGGRVECFALGQIPTGAKCYDINSAYPTAMLSRHCWGGKFEVLLHEPKNRFEQSFFRVKGRARGCFPLRTDEGLIYPDENREWFVTGWEYKAALETGAFKPDKIISVHRPEETRDFRKYVEHFYELKKNATNPTEKLFAKLMLNSFYGRFALNPRDHKETLWLPYGDTPDDFFEDDAARKGWEIDKIWPGTDLVLWSRKKPAEKWRFFDVALAASITGYVRAYLYRSLKQVKNPYYCDTDSIICEDGSALTLGTELGQWKLEAECEPNNLWIAGKKLYAMHKMDGEWKTAAKGVRLKGPEIRKIALGAVLTKRNQAPTYSLSRDNGYISRRIKRASPTSTQTLYEVQRGTIKGNK